MQKPQTQLFVWSLRDIIHDADLYLQALIVNTATQYIGVHPLPWNLQKHCSL